MPDQINPITKKPNMSNDNRIKTQKPKNRKSNHKTADRDRPDLTDGHGPISEKRQVHT